MLVISMECKVSLLPVGNKKVSMAGDPVGGWSIMISAMFTSVHHFHTVVQLVSLASLTIKLVNIDNFLVGC